MRRPLYETEANRRNERGVVSFLLSLGYTAIPLGPRSPADLICVMGETAFLTEYKKRSHTFGTYDTVILPEQKLRKCLSLAEEMGISFLYLVEFNDGLYASIIKDYHTTLGGRTDRGDPLDIHRVAHIRINCFKKIGSANKLDKRK